MNQILEFLVRYGAVVIFAAVFIEQMGLPLPCIPWLLAAGALAATGKMNGLVVLGVAVVGAVLADLIWFYLGRYGGPPRFEPALSHLVEPDSCVRKTQDVFKRYGMRGVVMGKFIPGAWGALVPSLAGDSGVSVLRFLLFDGLGSLLYVGGVLLVGVLFSPQLERIINGLAGLGKGALIVVVGLAALFIGYKYFQRHRLLRKLRMARITVDELHKKQEAGENLMILDLRSRGELEQNPLLIRGALHMTMDEVQVREQEIPRDRDIILYCSCPNEVSSASGWRCCCGEKRIHRVRPLLGGIDAWRGRNYPMEVRTVNVTVGRGVD